MLNKTYKFLLIAMLSFVFLEILSKDPEKDNVNGAGHRGVYLPFNFVSNTKVDDKTPLESVFKSAFNKGMENAVSETTQRVVSQSLNWVPNSVSYIGHVLASTIYRIAFGSRGFTSNDIVNINNHITGLCAPFVSQSAKGLDLQRRKFQIEQEESDEPVIDQNWFDFRLIMIKQLNHAICYLKESLPCYNVLYLDAPRNGLKHKLAKIVHVFSAEDGKQITFYTVLAIECISKLITIFESCNSIEQAYKKHDEIKRWLSLMTGAFEMVVKSLEIDKQKRVSFAKVNSGPSGTDLASMFGLSEK